MDADTPKPARPKLNLYTKALRRERVFARVQVGASIAEIAREEGLSEQRVRKIISDTLKRQEVDDLPDHALLQIFRLEGALAIAGKAIEAGDLKAIPPSSRFSTISTSIKRRASGNRGTTTPRGRNCSPRSTASPCRWRSSAADRRLMRRTPTRRRRQSQIPT